MKIFNRGIIEFKKRIRIYYEIISNANNYANERNWGNPVKNLFQS